MPREYGDDIISIEQLIKASSDDMLAELAMDCQERKAEFRQCDTDEKKDKSK